MIQRRWLDEALKPPETVICSKNVFAVFAGLSMRSVPSRLNQDAWAADTEFHQRAMVEFPHNDHVKRIRSADLNIGDL